MQRESFLSVVGSGRSWREIAWNLASFPVALVWGVLVLSLYATAGGLVVIWIGLPMLALCQLVIRWIGLVERVTINALLGDSIPPPEPLVEEDLSQPLPLTRWLRRLLLDTHAWRVLAWCLARLVSAPVGFVVAIGAIVAPVAAAGAFVLAILFVFGPLQVTWTDDTKLVGTDYWWLLPATAVVGLSLVPLMWWVSRGLTSLHRAFARWSLGPCEDRELIEVTARAQLAEERLRIDQELHDSIGHMITMNIIQAGAGAHVFDSDPEFARQALRNIEERGRAAMGELDRIIAALRGDDSVPRAPLPGVDELPPLLDHFRAAGMQLDATIEPPKVSAPIGRGAYAIVREALTNAARHAPGARVTLTITADGDALAIEVVNGQGDPGGDAVAGHDVQRKGGSGLAGIRDRAALLGGRAEVGLDGQDFVVRALLPAGAMLGGADPARRSRFDALRGKVSP